MIKKPYILNASIIQLVSEPTELEWHLISVVDVARRETAVDFGEAAGAWQWLLDVLHVVVPSSDEWESFFGCF